MNRALAVLGVVFAALLAPPVVARLFALEALHESDTLALWSVSIALALLSIFGLGRTRRRWPAKVALLAFTLLATELAARVYVAHFTSWPREKLAMLGRATYPDLLVYQPHPFLQFTGRPSLTLRGNAALSATTPFNREGFHDESVALEKPPGTCRIVCLGGSTTAGGFPRLMAKWLNERAKPGERYETMNLAHGFYDSTHSVVNFVLNAVDYAPDYVIIHHGWNDGRAAKNASFYRGDHSHVLKAFEPPVFPDWLPIRASVIYRFARFRIMGNEGWSFLDAALLQPEPDKRDVDLRPALLTFRRNIRTIVDLALLRGITPVLATMPYSTAEGVAFAANRPDLPPFADVLREIAASYDGRVLLVDLDREMTGTNELFVDLAHTLPAGSERKAEILGTALLAHRRDR